MVLDVSILVGFRLSVQFSGKTSLMVLVIQPLLNGLFKRQDVLCSCRKFNYLLQYCYSVHQQDTSQLKLNRYNTN